jgi:hypothetical protein
MLLTTVRLVALALGLCLGVEAAAQTNRSVLPSKFSYSIGGMVGFKSVEWNGKALIYQQTLHGRAVTNRTIRPTDKQWRQFWAATEQMQLSRWRPFYETPGVMDGWVWNIEFTHGTQKVKSFGRNAVPDDADVTRRAKETWPNKTFNALQSALEGLLGFQLR